MIVAEHIGNGDLRIIDRLREPVRLGSGLRNGDLTPETKTRALNCLERFGERIGHLPPGAVRAVGTNTLRQLHDSYRFLKQAGKALRHPIDVISGIEEARLIYLGVAHTLQSDQRRLVVDIGGGSTELIVGEQFQPLTMESVYAGCISVGRRAFGDGKLSHKAMRNAQLLARQEFELVGGTFRDQQWQAVVGASGTIRAARNVAVANGLTAEHHQGELSRDAVNAICEMVADAGTIDDLQLAGLKEDRRAVFPGGVAVLKAVFDELEIDFMSVSDGALREGLMFDLIGRRGADDVRQRSVADLASRYHVDPQRLQGIRDTATRLFRACRDAWELDLPDGEKFIDWAALLHPIGLDIAHSGYHKHGAYIIANADLSGFSREEKQLLALLVKGHRRKFPLAEVKALRGLWRRSAARTLALLRLAVILHRGRTTPPDEMSPNAKEATLKLSIPTSWLEQHPLTAAELQQEQRHLKAAGLQLLI